MEEIFPKIKDVEEEAFIPKFIEEMKAIYPGFDGTKFNKFINVKSKVDVFKKIVSYGSEKGRITIDHFDRRVSTIQLKTGTLATEEKKLDSSIKKKEEKGESTPTVEKKEKLGTSKAEKNKTYLINHLKWRKNYFKSWFMLNIRSKFQVIEYENLKIEWEKSKNQGDENSTYSILKANNYLSYEVFMTNEIEKFIKKSLKKNRSIEKECLIVSFRAKRNWESYFYRICLIMMIITLLLNSIFIIEPEAVGDRLGFGVTILLTEVAYILIIHDTLPKLNYLTLLEYYIISLFTYIALIMISITLNFVCQLYDDTINFVCSLLLWIIIHILFIFTINQYKIPHELKKLNERIDEAEDFNDFLVDQGTLNIKSEHILKLGIEYENYIRKNDLLLLRPKNKSQVGTLDIKKDLGKKESKRDEAIEIKKDEEKQLIN